MYTDVYGQFKLGHLDPLFFSLSYEYRWPYVYSSFLFEFMWMGVIK